LKQGITLPFLAKENRIPLERERERERGEMGARECEAKGDHQKAVEREKKGLGLFDLEEG
jgi:hypothetical protein